MGLDKKADAAMTWILLLTRSKPSNLKLILSDSLADRYAFQVVLIKSSLICFLIELVHIETFHLLLELFSGLFCHSLVFRCFFLNHLIRWK